MPSPYDRNRDLCTRYQAGDEQAAELLLRLNEPLVQSIAVRYHAPGWELPDFLQEGRLALLHAARRFDPERGCEFSTYATFWIRQAISRAAMQGSLIRLPTHAMERARKAARPAADPREQAWAAQLPAVVTSLDTPVGEDTDLAEWRAATVDVEAEVLGRLHVAELLAGLEPRERFVLTRRLGLDGGGQDTLAEVGAAVGRAKETVRLQTTKALGRLRERLVSAG